MKLSKSQNRLLYSKFRLCLCLFLLTSCVEDVDFDQPTDITLTPIAESSLIFFEVEGNAFVVNGFEVQTVTDEISNIEIFQDDFVNEDLERVELYFEINNQIERRFDMQIDFIDIDGQLQRSTTFSVVPSEDGQTTTTEHIETFDEASIDQLKNTYTLRFTLRMQPSDDGSILDENTTETLELNSRGLFYFRIEV